MKLNIGSGGNCKKGYINIDKFHPSADKKCNADDTGFPADSVDEIFTSHMVEHLELDEFIAALTHWYTILKSGGKLFILCPNAFVYLNEWLDAASNDNLNELSGWARRNVLGWEGKGIGMMNKNLFTPHLLKALVASANFKILYCKSTVTRVKDRDHFEYRHDGDLELEAYK